MDEPLRQIIIDVTGSNHPDDIDAHADNLKMILAELPIYLTVSDLRQMLEN